MKSTHYKLNALFIGALSIATIQVKAADATDVSQVARNVTLQISGQGGYGSGVIIHRKGNIYTALTAAHVVPTNTSYRVFTLNKKQEYAVDSKTVKRFPGLDLAIFKFTSQSNYEVVALRRFCTACSGQPLLCGWLSSNTRRA